MSLVEDRRAGASVPTARLMVLLSERGLRVLPGIDADLEKLMALEAVARGQTPGDAVSDVARETGAVATELEAFLDRLGKLGLLAADAPPARRFGAVEPAPLRALDDSTPVVIQHPVNLRATDRGFEALDHDGRSRAALTAPELAVAARLVRPHTRAELVDVDTAAATPLGAARIDAMLRKLVAAGLVAPVHESDVVEQTTDVGDPVRLQLKLKAAIRRSVAAHEEAERQRMERTGVARTRVVPVAFDKIYAPLGLGLIVANAKADLRLDAAYHFCPSWMTDRTQIAQLAVEPSVFLFSTYLWSYRQCLEMSELVKSINPANVTVFGGPSTPRYEGDCREFFGDNPHVDVTVRGEGEVTAKEILVALAGQVGGDGPPDLSVLADVAGLSYRDGDRVVRTADRERLSDLDTVPSPFLTGLFDAYTKVPGFGAIIETNRGCPYGCTFCDWGSATLSRIRKYSLERVYAELEWCARNRVQVIAPADSNFGIWSRDVDIARKVTELKAQYGSPNVFGVNFAKNTAKHLRTIIQLLIEADIFTYGVLSLQSMDTDTLDAIDRQNIRLAKYEELAVEFRKAGLPLFVDLMLGLPGQTAASFRNDIQECIDREVQLRIPITTMLVNSPMNEPSYRKRFKIVTSTSPLDPTKVAQVVQTSTFTESEYHEMRALRLAVLLAEDLGVLRHVARYVHAETGMREVDFYDRLLRDATADPDRWPTTAVTLQQVPHVGAPPVSWRLLIDEVHAYLTDVLGLADDSALTAVLAVQHALLPAADRALPLTLALDHDVAAWHRQMLAVKEDGHRGGWHTLVRRLRSFPPARFTVDDRGGVLRWAMGQGVEQSGFGLHWELWSDIARPVVHLAAIAGDASEQS